MANPRVMIVGGGLAGLSAAMKLAELGVDVDLMSLTPVKRSHSVCAQGGINSVNEVTRQQGDSEWLHFDDTVYGGDFLQHQPPVKEMTDWAPKIIDLMDRLGRALQSHARGLSRPAPLRRHALQAHRFRRRHHRPAVALRPRRPGAPLERRGQGEDPRNLGLSRPGARRRAASAAACVGQDLVTMEIRAFPADAVVVASGGCGLIYGRSTMSMVCTGSAASRTFQAGAKYGNAEFIQVHPTAIPGADKLRLMSESARGEGGRVWVPRKPQDPRPPKSIPEAERYYFLEERYPKYGNLVPRDIATREIFNVCTHEGLERRARPAVRLSRSDAHPAAHARPEARRHPRDLREVPGRRPARRADENLPRRPLLDGRAVGRLRKKRRRRPGRRLATQPAHQHPQPLRHRRVRLPVSRGQPAGRQLAVELHLQRLAGRPGHRQPDQGRAKQAGRTAARACSKRPSSEQQAAHDRLLDRPARRREPLPAAPGTRRT